VLGAHDNVLASVPSIAITVIAVTVAIALVAANVPPAFPVSTPGFVAPFPAAPAAELGTVDRAAFTILKHAFLPIRPARVDAQRLDAAMVGVHAKRAVAHAEGTVLTRHILQAVRDIHVIMRCTVLGAHDDVLASVAGGVL